MVAVTGSDNSCEHLLRELAPQVLGVVVRRFQDFAASEEAVQESLLAAATQWPREGSRIGDVSVLKSFYRDVHNEKLPNGNGECIWSPNTGGGVKTFPPQV